MNQREERDAVEKLDAIGAIDPEKAHSQADEIILSLVPLAVREAYERLKYRQEWWTCA